VTSRVTIDDAARDELSAAIDWYEERRRGLGAEVLAEVQHALELIARHPRVGTPVPRVAAEIRTRRVALRRFPYSIVYREAAEAICVVAFAHHSRRPGYWRPR
jgi:toxin ParE1/3/4